MRAKAFEASREANLVTQPRAAGPRVPSTAAPGSWRGTALAVLVLAGVLAVFFAPAIFSRDQFLFRDNGRMHWPVKSYIAEQLRHGQLSEWNPYTGLGVPLISGAIDAVQHPFNLLFALLPFEVAFKLWGLLCYLVAATGAFAWARGLGRSWSASIAAGLAFALSGPLVGSSDNLTYLTTLAALPWVFAAAHAWFERHGPGRLALLGLASGVCAAGGDPQAWGFAVLLLPVYALAIVRAEGRWWHRTARGAGAAAAALVGAAPFILPVLAWMPESSRATGVLSAELQIWNLPLPRLLELVIPHMYRDAPGSLSSPVYLAFGNGGIPWVLSVYVGVSVLVLALLGAARSRASRWLLLLAGLFTWMALGNHAGFGQLLPHLPVLRGFRYWEKMAIWTPLLLAIPTAFGFDEIVGGRLRTRWAASIALLGLAALAATACGRCFSDDLVRLLQRHADAAPARTFAGNLLDGLLESGAVCVVLGVAIAAIQRGVVRHRPAALLALVLVADLLAANVRGYTLADPAIVDQRGPFADYLRSRPGLQRVFTPYDLPTHRWPQLREFEAGWIWAGRMLEVSFNVGAHTGNFFPYTGMIPVRAERFRLRAPVDKHLPHIGIFGVGYMPVPASPEKAGLAGLAPPYQVAAVDPLLPAFLVRLPHRERAYLAAELSAVDRRGAMEFVLAVDPAKSDGSVVEGEVPDGYLPPRGEARITDDAPERVAVETAADRRALLVLNDTYASGWTAAVDGIPAAILPTNYLVRGVWVGPGRHQVVFRYRTPGLREGWLVFGAGALALAAWALALRFRRRSVRIAGANRG